MLPTAGSDGGMRGIVALCRASLGSAAVGEFGDDDHAAPRTASALNSSQTAASKLSDGELQHASPAPSGSGTICDAPTSLPPTPVWVTTTPLGCPVDPEV